MAETTNTNEELPSEDLDEVFAEFANTRLKKLKKEFWPGAGVAGISYDLMQTHFLTDYGDRISEDDYIRIRSAIGFARFVTTFINDNQPELFSQSSRGVDRDTPGTKRTRSGGPVSWRVYTIIMSENFVWTSVASLALR